MRLHVGGPENAVEVVLTQAQIAAIKTAFSRTPGWQAFLEYCEWRAGRRPSAAGATFIAGFEDDLRSIIGRYTAYDAVVVWRVLDEMVSQT